jgi:hypothetical protein
MQPAMQQQQVMRSVLHRRLAQMHGSSSSSSVVCWLLV